ncbi:5-formyltetrahydrofolate cyclo-ligase [Paenibacillus sinopodophylli]|uniref:5-formyltetrahydrofolate cyclo-ligase n=1 Tax=Paenibacillus sinopodophylli TaxID=1837342 RepID=UPI001FECF276|nr:5-formyltetrahydrofolate cyclo-ligase [Paenibacillus sinopodophylli]
MSILIKPNLPGDKAYIRNQMTLKRNSLSLEQREIWSEMACTQAQEWLEEQGAAAIMVYVAFRSELDFSALIEWCWRTGVDVIVPRCIAMDRSMTLYYLRSWDDLQVGAYGIMEPDPDRAEMAEQVRPSVVLVPGLAFDRQGGRLGYGGGYYDRFAEAIQNVNREHADMIWLGAAFEEQLIDEVPLEQHDLRMSGIITERGVRMH